MKFPIVIVAGLLAAGAGLSAPAVAQEGDAEAGKRVFNQCRACHTVEPGQHRIGPSLHNVIGRTPGTVEDFRNYSPAMKEYGKTGAVWNSETLDAYLKDPKAVVPGGRMAFPGLRRPEDRTDVIAYLESVSEGD